MFFANFLFLKNLKNAVYNSFTSLNFEKIDNCLITPSYLYKCFGHSISFLSQVYVDSLKLN